MLVTLNPVTMMTQFAPKGSLPDPGTIGMTAAGIMRFDPTNEMQSLKVAGAMTAPELMPGAVVGAALTAEGSIDMMLPVGLKARVEYALDPAMASPALTGYTALLQQQAGAIAGLESNIDPAQFDTQEKMLEFLKSMGKDELIFGAQVGAKTVLWRGTTDALPAGIADVVRASDALHGTLA